MKCKCGYEGWAELGYFKDEREKFLPRIHFRCPKCKHNNDMEYLHPIDLVREAMAYPKTCSEIRGETAAHTPANVVVDFYESSMKNALVGYSIHCPLCHWGHASGITREDFEKLKGGENHDGTRLPVQG